MQTSDPALAPDAANAAGATLHASTMTRQAFVVVCLLVGFVMLLVGVFAPVMHEAGQPVPPMPGASLAAGVLLIVVGAVLARRRSVPAWFSPAVALALIGLSMTAVWFNGLLAMQFYAPLLVMLHLLLTLRQARWASAWLLTWPVVMVPHWIQTQQLPMAMRAWAGALLVGLMVQFVVRQNGRFADAARTLLGAIEGANRQLHEANLRTSAALKNVEQSAAELAAQMDRLAAERDRAREALEHAEHERKRAEDALVQNIVLEHEHDRLSRLLRASTDAMPLGLMVLDPLGRFELTNPALWALIGIDPAVVDPQDGFAGLVRHNVACGHFDAAAPAALSLALKEYDEWRAQAFAEGSQGSGVRGAGGRVALNQLRLFRGWPMTLSEGGKLVPDTGTGGASSVEVESKGTGDECSTISYTSRAVSGRVMRVKSTALANGGVVRIYTDVSDLVATAEALGRSLGELREKDALLQAEVLRSRNEIELNNRFVASVSHEIRTAVQGVTGIAALLQSDAAAGHETTLVREMFTSAQDLQRLSDDLLSLARLRRASFSLTQGVFDPVSVVERCVQRAMNRLDPEAVRLRWTCHAPMPLLTGDEQRVAQVVGNLLQNAAKFTRRGHIRVDAWLVAEEMTEGNREAETGAETGGDGAPVYLHVRVADTGRGIPYGLVGRVFEPFDQGDPSTNRDHGGTGLGLALSLELCEAMSGSIGVLSRSGVGSVFEMCVRLTVARDALPCAERERLVEARRGIDRPSDAAVDPADPSVPWLPGIRVLVVDDNRLNRKLMSMWIEARGGVVTMAADGADGVRLALAGDFDCILMDMSMPVMNGLDAARAIRAAGDGVDGGECRGLPTARGGSGRAHVPMIGVTAMARREDRLLCLAAGMDAHVAKPVRNETLIRAVRRVTAARRWLQAARASIDRRGGA